MERTYRGVALVGPMAAGKTTIANVLIERHGFRHLSMIGAFRELFAEAYPGLTKGDEITVRQDIAGGAGTFREVTLSGRGLMQAFGEFTRQADSDFWPRIGFNRLRDWIDGGGFVVSDDVRFPTEADLCRREGLLVARVETPRDIRRYRYAQAYGRPFTEAEENAATEVAMAGIEPDVVLDGRGSPAVNAAILANAVGSTTAVVPIRKTPEEDTTE